ncbi:hypothetical protein AB0K60_31050, partial [Thermopolyspora sp. NPDC052614]|uniref:hypothetical protein n=1 Tax=Thermopolyspora sp. NPDC052614 TaxID=3155682 RepID=UPI0034228169
MTRMTRVGLLGLGGDSTLAAPPPRPIRQGHPSRTTRTPSQAPPRTSDQAHIGGVTRMTRVGLLGLG